MNINIHSNPCLRCGKERIVFKVYEEKVGYSTVTTKEMVCPDNDCQREMDIENKKRTEKYAAIKFKSEQRNLERQAAKKAERAATAAQK